LGIAIVWTAFKAVVDLFEDTIILNGIQMLIATLVAT